MDDGLSLELIPEGDGSAELRVSARSNGFAGASSAYFPPETVRDFAKALAEYPLGERARTGLAGGYWDMSGKELKETHLALSATQIDRLGTLSFKVTLATPDQDTHTAHRVELQFKTSYAKLEQFAAELHHLVDGKRQRAELRAELSAEP